MNFVFILLAMFTSSIGEGVSITILDAEAKAEVFTAVDNFTQHHANNFKLNLFTVSSNDRDDEGNKGAKYIFGITNYSGPSRVYQAGVFYAPQIIEVSRRNGSLELMVEHGSYIERNTVLITVTNDLVTMTEVFNN